jgi:hypothetical protein
MEHPKRVVEKDPPLKKDDLIVITGAGGLFQEKRLHQYPCGG